jgi:hypothetical protein
MRNALALTIAVILVALAVTKPANAYEGWPVVPPEQGIYPVVRPAPVPWRCSEEPVTNFYHGAYYREVPAVYHGYAYRQHYRYTAWRVVPRTYACAGW